MLAGAALAVLAVSSTAGATAPADSAAATPSDKSVAAGTATTAPDTASKPTVASVTKQLADLSGRNEQLTEQFNQAVIDVKAKQNQAAAAQLEATQKATAYVGARDQVKLSLQAQYQEGGFRETTALLTSQSGQDYLDQSSALQHISDRRAGMALRMRAARAMSIRATETAAALLTSARVKRDALTGQRASLQVDQTKYKALLSTLTVAEQRSFLQSASDGVSQKQLTIAVKNVTKHLPIGNNAPTQQRRTGGNSATTQQQPTGGNNAPTQQRRTGGNSATKQQQPTGDNNARPQQQPTKQQQPTGGNNAPTQQQPTGGNTAPTQQQPTGGNNAPTQQQPTGGNNSAPAPSNAAAVAVAFALAQRGKPYVYATSGPNSYDCSGLTAAAWQAAGVQIPHQSVQQYGIGHHVSRDELQPGDLVFFYSPIHHVGLYIGNGLIVHAPTEGDVVKVVPLNLAGPYTGATRL